MSAKILHGVFTGTAAAVGELPSTSEMSSIVFVISGLAAETVSVTARVRTTVYTAAMRPMNLATGALAAASALTNGEYQFVNCNFDSIKFTKSSTSDTVVISWRTEEI